MSTVTAPSGGKRPTSGSTDTPTRDKRLKTIACDRCRRRKVKCDGDGYNHTPCKYCVSVSLPCTYGQKTGRTSTAPKANPTSSRQTSRSKSTSSVATSNVDNVAVTSGTLTASNTSRQRKPSSHVTSHQNNKQPTKKSSQTSNYSFNFSTNTNRTSRIVPPALPDPDTKKNDVEYVVILFTSMTLQDETQVRQRLKPYTQQISESSPPHPQTNHALFEDSSLTEHLVDLYFKNFHPLLPVLHKAYFMERFHDKNKSISRLLLCAVCAIGSSYTNNPAARNNQHAVGMAFYQYAQEMVNHYFDLARLSTATALLLLGVFDALRSLKSRIYVGMATTLAITMKLHDKNSFPETLTINEREARKRLWWGISITNHLNCITLNKMLALQDNHCSIDFPDENENCNDDKECKIIEYFKHYLNITKIIYDVLEFNLSDNCESDNILEERLNIWKNSLPPFLNIEGAKGLEATYNETTIEHLRIYLCILYNYAIIRIHHPNISSLQSLAACTRAANNITSFVNEHFVNMINSKQFIIHCALYAGFIHILNLKDSQHSEASKRNIITTIKLFQNVLNMPSLHYTHYGIKNLIAIFASQLEGIPDVESSVKDFVKSALVLISGNAGNSSSNPVTASSTEDPRNNNNNNNNHNHNHNNNNVSNIVQDNSPMNLNLGLKKFSPIQQSAQNSPPGINLLAHTAATRSPHYIPLSPINHGPSGQQTTQSIFTTSPTPLDPPVTSTKIDSTNTSLITDINFSSAHYINQHSNQTRQHDSTYYNNNNYQWTTQQSSHLQPIQTQPTTMSPTGNETMMVINNSPVSTSSSLRSMSILNSSSLPPLFATTNTSTHTAFTSSQMQFPYPTALPSIPSSQPRQYYLASNSTSPPSTIGIGGNFVTSSDMSTGLAPMTGMLGNSGGVTNGIMSTSENSVSMLIDSQESSIPHSSELDAHHHHHHQQQQRRSSQQTQWWCPP